MSRQIDLAQVLLRHQRVDLRRCHAGMSQKLLNHAHVRPALEEVRRERMPERVRAHAFVDGGSGHVALQDLGAALTGQPSAARVQEEGAARGARRERGPSPGHVPRQRPSGVLPQGHQALLAPLSQDADALLVEVDVVHVQADELRDAEPRAVQRLEDGAVAQRRGVRAARRLQHLLDLVHRERPWERPRHLGADRGAGRILLGFALPNQEPMERPHGGEGSGDGRCTVTLPALLDPGFGERCHEARHDGVVASPCVTDPLVLAMPCVPRQILPVRGDGVGGEATLHDHMIEEPLDLCEHGVPGSIAHETLPAQPWTPSISCDSATVSMSCASATPPLMSCPPYVLTPMASAGSPRTASSNPFSAMASAYGSVTLVKAYVDVLGTAPGML